MGTVTVIDLCRTVGLKLIDPIIGILAVGSNTISLTNPSDPTILTVAGQTFTPNPSAFPIADTVLSADDPAITINGTLISLRPSDTRVIDSSTIPLLLPSDSSSHDLVIDSFDIEEHSSSFVIVDGITLSAAAPGITIFGEVIRLEAGGKTLDIGTERYALPTTGRVGNGSSINRQAFTGSGQGKKEEGVEVWLLFLVCELCGFVVLLLV